MSLDLSFQKPDGSPLKLADFHGKVLLVVNTASKCGFTKQYESLQRLYEAYHDKGLEIIAVPSNDFGNQEPGTDEQIQSFCQINYGVTFPVTHKEKVSGEGAHPFYQHVKKQLGFLAAPKWNFQKILVDRQGNLIDYFLPITSPDNTKIIKAIESLL